jgi:hypothetical protein
MSNGVAVMVSEVARRVPGAGRLALLRIHSHGAPGSMNVSAGEEAQDEHMTSLDISTLYYTGPQLAALAPLFARFGCMELMGCNVGAGERGRQLLDRVARYVGVPVSAGVQTQYSGAGIFRFEGPVRTGYPYGGTLRGWSAAATT